MLLYTITSIEILSSLRLLRCIQIKNSNFCNVRQTLYMSETKHGSAFFSVDTLDRMSRVLWTASSYCRSSQLEWYGISWDTAGQILYSLCCYTFSHQIWTRPGSSVVDPWHFGRYRSGSADSYRWLTDPALYVFSTFKIRTKNNFFPSLFCGITLWRYI